MLLVNSVSLGDDRGRGRSTEKGDLIAMIRVGIQIQDPSTLTICPMARRKIEKMMKTMTKTRMMMAA
jgi:hypothetical protein